MCTELSANSKEKDTRYFDVDKYSHGDTYVPSKVAIAIRYLTEYISVSCDDINNGRVWSHKQLIISQFPKLLSPIQHVMHMVPCQLRYQY